MMMVMMMMMVMFMVMVMMMVMVMVMVVVMMMAVIMMMMNVNPETMDILKCMKSRAWRKTRKRGILYRFDFLECIRSRT